MAAFVLALLLAVAWSWRDWHDLSALRLPDTDDVMRLQQIRDWLAGQRFSDLSQHRLGADPGLAMHWSRLPDLVPGAIIAALVPMIGRHGAEIAAVIAWPAMLLATALFLIARIARTLGGPEIARTALIVAAIAYPSSTIFLPGRIDHHGFQVVLLLVMVHALTVRHGMARGLFAGFAAAASIAIGLETLPLIAVAGGVVVIGWIGADTDDTLMGFGIALAAGLLAANTALRTDQFLYPACDGFTAITWRVAQFAAFAPIVLAIAGYASQRRDVRIALAGLAGAVTAYGVWHAAPICLSPYGHVDPMLARLWLAHVGEAQSLFAAPTATAVGYAGLMVAGIVASLWRLYRTHNGLWATLLAFQVGALLLTCLQLRGAYAGAILAAPALAAVIAVARRRGTPALAAAWIGSAGMLYPIAANAFVPVPQGDDRRATGGGSCTSTEALARLARLPQGRLLAPLDLGAYAIGATKLSVVGAPYHRNNAGNGAVYRFFLGTPAAAQEIAKGWHIRYVALCPDSFGELGAADPRSLMARVRAGHAPAWMRPIEGPDDGLTLFEVQPRLFGRPPTL
ncbi:hypothetical protein [Sphingomonas sp. GB1N7]|uniref:hypothetical protein n=1 Tax=Parasphingomonas caseinilytica TaxID=3096158 RepID=UPI002FC8C2C7